MSESYWLSVTAVCHSTLSLVAGGRIIGGFSRDKIATSILLPYLTLDLAS